VASYAPAHCGEEEEAEEAAAAVAAVAAVEEQEQVWPDLPRPAGIGAGGLAAAMRKRAEAGPLALALDRRTSTMRGGSRHPRALRAT
jgi:hypothetical protein